MRSFRLSYAIYDYHNNEYSLQQLIDEWGESSKLTIFSKFSPKGARVASTESAELSSIKLSWFELSNGVQPDPNHTKISSIKIRLKILIIVPEWLCLVGPNEWLENK